MWEKCGISTVNIIAKRHQSRILMRIHLPEQKAGNTSKACNVCRIERKPYTKPYAPPYGRDQTNGQRGKKRGKIRLGGGKQRNIRQDVAVTPCIQHAGTWKKRGNWFAVVWTQTAPRSTQKENKNLQYKKKTWTKNAPHAILVPWKSPWNKSSINVDSSPVGWKLPK